ncbi:MAG TPA: hypothetical protein VJU86_03435 [Pyrinomonadaceae bacterium]|nr:hypothetical protein [Pyrinomonadaceae bacterium]
MAIELTVVDENGNPFPAGTALVLLADGRPLARAELDVTGVACFEVDTANIKRLAVKLDE